MTRTMDIELFPCAGGMAEGFRRAGMTFDLAIELMENHCDSYEANLGHRPLQMDARSFLSLLQEGWRPPHPVRALVADPPCTPWSRSGKRLGTNDPRDMLEGTCRIIELLKPSVYLIGNVPGLDDGPNLGAVQRTIGELSRVGYCTADFTRLDAANYGVPQHRIRPFWFGHLYGPCIAWPLPSHCDPDRLHNLAIPGTGELLPWVTCRAALGHLSGEQLGRPVRIRKRNSNSKQHGSVPERPARTVGTSNLSDGNMLLPFDAPRAGKRGRKRDQGRPGQGMRTGDFDQPAKTVVTEAPRKGAGASAVLTLSPERGNTLARADHPAPTLTGNTHGNGSILINDRHKPATMDAPAPTLGAKERGQSAQVIITSSKHPSSSPASPAMTLRASDGEGANRTLEWPWDRPSVTVEADPRLPPGHHDADYSARSLPGVVISELAGTILQGFPESWVFVGKSKKQRWSQIGQAMPPPLAHAVAACVVRQIQQTDPALVPHLATGKSTEHDGAPRYATKGSST